MAGQFEVISRELIKPSSQTPPHLRNYNLSYFDQDCTRMYIPLVLFYTNPCNSTATASTSETSKILKKSLSETLAFYYPFSGKIKDRYTLECSDEGVVFLEVKLNLELTEILKSPKTEIVDLLFADNLQWKDTNLSTLLAVQVSYFDCGGMALSVCMSHKIGDAATLVNFINDWAAKASNSSKEVSPLFYTPSLFPRGDLPIMPEFATKQDQNCVSRRFVFDASSIAALKASVADKVPNPTRVEVVSALLYKCTVSVSEARSSGTTRPTLFLQNVNLRTRMTPPLPENYVGNVGSAIPVTKRDDSLHSLVGQMKEALSEFCSTYVKELRGTELIMSMRNHFKNVKAEFKNSEQCAQYICSSWCRFPIYDADFGWGKPVWVNIGACMDNNLFLLMDSKNGDGIEAFVTLEEQDMAAFECDEELLEFASINPTAYQPSM